ncbi:unnamed protein product [Bursaphelenchus okinawaensis]|uniref:Spermidine synthase n=1 Tax=Bursaphelenchus okinawaensis TaxID=465554 RepID=A0A811JTR2_9BILA|nr:unnamed protein product [Bursaphelenchus okinawaensis]CAG9082682.1 unnamed protein product [Bursaphelenchus okinawaensis]
MSLAEELLADLDDGEEPEDFPMEEEDVSEVVEEVMETSKPVGLYNRISDVAKLSNSTEYRKAIGEMNDLMKLPEVPPFTSPLETDPQYMLVVQLSELAIEIEQEITVIHKFVRDKYEKRFPELETLVQMPLDYMATVKLLGNEIATRSQNKDLFVNVLPSSGCIILSVTATNTQGVPLTEEELNIVIEACEMAEKIQADRLNIHQFVEERMTLIAPNLCKILGSGTAAMIVSQAGGLGPLAKQPACNILVLGKKKRTLAGFSTTAINPHSGFIFYHPLVQRLPPDHRQKAARIIAAKCALASRVDSLHQSLDGAIGDGLAAEIKRRIDILLEPPSVKFQKPLPKPLDKASKKRGGRRVRKEKERMGMTELRKKANRMNFAEIEEDVRQDAIGFSLGQVKSQSMNGGGRLRTTVDNKNKQKMSQKLQKTLQRRQHGGMTAIKTSNANGMMSSVSFTPVQGMNQLKEGWFSELSPDQDGTTENVLGNHWAGQAFSLQVEEVLYHQRSQYQNVLVFKSNTYGNVLALDGVIQCTERDEFAYHEMMAHLPLFSHKNPKTVLVVGGGDGGVVREVVKHSTVESVTLCEIDKDVVDVAKKYFPTISSALDDKKVNVVIGDGLQYLQNQENVYDVVITDSSDPQGPAEGLFGLNFYKLLKRSLKKDGIIISQGECPWIDLTLISNVISTVKTLFPVVRYAMSSVPTYTTGTMGYLLCSNDADNDLINPAKEREDLKAMNLRYYNYDLHKAVFALPNFIRETIGLQK